jgi:hypothetical protein
MSIQGAVTQHPVWPKFDGNVWKYLEFKERGHEIQKTGIGGKQLLKIIWKDCLPHNIVEELDRFADITAMRKYLDQLFGWNKLCEILQAYESYPEDK